MGNENRIVVTSMMWTLLERFGTQLVSFIISIILARILMPDDYGIIAIVLVFISFANIIITGGLNTALIQKKDSDQKDYSTIFWFCLCIAAVVYSVLFFSAPLISRFYGKELLTPVLRVLGIIVFFGSINSIQFAFVSRHMLFRKNFYVNAVALVISGSVGILLAYKGFGVWALVGQYLLSSIIICILLLFAIRWKPTLEFSLSRFKGLFDFGWKVFLTNFIITVYENIRSLIIGKLYQPSTLAYFDRGKQMPNLIMGNVTSSIQTVLLPAFSNEQDNRIRVKQMMRRALTVSYLFVAPLLAGFFFASKEIVLLLLTEKWLPAVPFIRIFCIAFLLMPIQNINATAIQALGYSNLTLKIEIIKKIIEAIILVISFMMNVYAVAWGIVLYNAICIPINLSPAKRLIDYGAVEQLKDICLIILASLIMGAVVFSCELLPIGNIWILSIQVLSGAVIYFFLCKLFRFDSLTYVLKNASAMIGDLAKGKHIIVNS